jgi:DNA-binding LacI/PurR family transcriptional regulator
MSEYLYLKIYEDLKENIVNGVLVDGQRLPTEKDLIEKYNVSRITAIKAMQKLEIDGLVKRTRGSGTYVTYNNFLTFHRGYIPLDIKSKNIAFIGYCSAMFIARILSSFQHNAVANGYNVSVFDTSSDKICEADILKAVMEGNFSGIVYHSRNITQNLPGLLEIVSKRIPLVFIDEDIHMFRVPCVKTNNYLGGYKMGQCLIEHGHKNIGVVFGNFQNHNEQERFGGLIRAMTENGLDLNIRNVFQFDATQNTRYINGEDEKGIISTIKGNLQEIFHRKDRPTAFFGLRDSVASFVQQHAFECGFKVPDDFSVVGYNNDPFCEQMLVPLSSVDQKYGVIGKMVFELLTRIINGEQVPIENLVEPVVVMRKSLKNINETHEFEEE